jgi:hypothetical protein
LSPLESLIGVKLVREAEGRSLKNFRAFTSMRSEAARVDMPNG